MRPSTPTAGALSCKVIGIIDILDPTSWVFWFAAGAEFFAIEVLLPTILALGFGVGAWMASALIFFILPADVLSVPLVLVVWAILSAACWIVLRIIFRNRHSGNKAPDGDIRWIHKRSATLVLKQRVTRS